MQVPFIRDRFLIVLEDRMRYVFRKPDLDTVTAAVLLGYRSGLPLSCVSQDAQPSDLADPAVICLECGGAGQSDLGNFDHHDPLEAFPPACVQAAALKDPMDSGTKDLIAYVAAVDTGSRLCPPDRAGLTLSAVFSGMRLVVPDLTEQFQSGAALVAAMIARQASPWDVPRHFVDPAWIVAKRLARRRTASMEGQVERFMTNQGRLGMFLRVGSPGAHGLMRRLGADISVANGLLTSSHYSISGHAPLMALLTEKFNALEVGWGGPKPGEIIGSPLRGTYLDDATIRACVCRFG